MSPRKRLPKRQLRRPARVSQPAARRLQKTGGIMLALAALASQGHLSLVLRTAAESLKAVGSAIVSLFMQEPVAVVGITIVLIAVAVIIERKLSD